MLKLLEPELPQPADDTKSRLGVWFLCATFRNWLFTLGGAELFVGAPLYQGGRQTAKNTISLFSPATVTRS